MTSKERVMLAASHEEPDRVPITFDAETQVIERLQRHFGVTTREELWQRLQVDTRLVGARNKPGLSKDLGGGVSESIWGTRSRTVAFGAGDTAGQYTDVIHNPLSGDITAEAIRNHPWPSYDLKDYSDVVPRCRELAEYALIGHATLGVFFSASFLRGMDDLLMDMMAEPERATLLIDKIRSYVIHDIREVLRHSGEHLDILYIADDFCMQQAPMMAPPVFEHFFFYIRELAELAHENGCKFLFHCCGAVRPLLPLMIEAGVDILEPIQTRAAGMEVTGLKRDFGDRLCFYGSVDLQNVLVRGSTADVEAEVLHNMRELGRGGGLIIGPGHTFIQPDAPLENILTMYETAHERGTYPLGS